MLINVSEDEEYRIGVVEDGSLEELYLERTQAERQVGNIYVGRVQNVEPSIQAAFVEIGTKKNGFLHVSDVRPDVRDLPPKDTPSDRRGKNADTDIRDLLNKGDQILVQVTREAIDGKGPSLTSYISLPGKYLVMLPGVSHHGVSRKIQDQSTRKRLRGLLKKMDLPEHAGFIVRTAGEGRTKRDLQRDLQYLRRLWDAVCNKLKSARPPATVYQESDLIIRCVRDLFTSDTDEIIVDSEGVSRKVQGFLSIVAPSYKNRVKLYQGKVPLFTKFEIADAIEEVYSREVKLPSGGSIVIEQTEALVAIDVNSGKYTEETDAETTAYRTNMEAAPEVARQLRLRDLGGVIVIDFIDVEQSKHRRDVEKTLHKAMVRDRARSRALRMSQFGLVQITRQRMRTSVPRAVFRTCPMCDGRGHIRTLESLTLDLMRAIRRTLPRKKIDAVECRLHPSVALHILNEKRDRLLELEQRWDKKIHIATDSNVSLDEIRVLGIRGNKTVSIT
ncbi:MAG: Rne/Rng family ribonuclease [Planctomycetota bacterium]